MSEEEIDPGLELILPDERDDVRDRWLWGAVLVILTLWAFSPSIFGHYIWDDNRYPQNPVIRQGTDGLNDIWFKPSQPPHGNQPGRYVTPQYYPMTFTSYWLGYQIWQQNPLAEHIVNIFLHAGSALLIWEILRRLKVPGAWVAAAIFAVHPLQTETVAWIAERKNVLAGVFFFGSILTYLQFLKIDKENESAQPQGADYQWYALSLVLFVAGLLSKSIVCSMPVVIAILLWWKRRLSAKHIALLIPFVAFGLAMSAVTRWFEINIVGAMGGDWEHSPVEHVLIAAHIVWFYVYKLIAPVNLTLIYRKWSIDSFQWIYLAALVVALGILVALIGKKGRGPLAAVLIYLVTLVPAMGFFNVFPMRYSYVADHFQYLSGIALIVLGVAIVGCLLKPLGAQRRIAGVVLAIAIVGIFAVTSWSHAKIYTDPETLWDDVIAKNPTAWVAYDNLAGVLDDEAQSNLADVQDIDIAKPIAEAQAREAIDASQNAIKLRSGLATAHDHWGQALLILDKPAEALEEFQKAKAINPLEARYCNNVGVALTRLKRTAEAEKEYREGLTIPGSSTEIKTLMRVNLGQLLLNDGDVVARDAKAATASADQQKLSAQAMAIYAQAQEQFDAASKESPESADAWLHLGTSLMRQTALIRQPSEVLKKDGEAFEAFSQAVRINPDLYEAHANLGLLYSILGQYPQASQEYILALNANPKDADVVVNMGIMAEQVHKFPEARELFENAIKLDPKNERAKEELAKLARLTTQPTTSQAASTQTAPATMQAATGAAGNSKSEGVSPK